ncbi:hypothetical protein D9601_12835 [Sphingomonas sp. MA1305]|nr:hypothetical protein [Sphingomonas sp. MA1305]
MLSGLNPECVQRSVDDQLALAELATCESVKAMHQELAALYRAQLVCLLAAEVLVDDVAGVAYDRAA